MVTQSALVVAGERPRAEAPPDLAGWAGAASAVHAIQQMPTPVTLRLDVEGHGVIAIDFVYNAFEWAGSLTEFPDAPVSVLVETRPGLLDAASVELPGRPLDPLLFSIGYHAFGDGPATWLDPAHRYRLRRWPSLSDIPISLDQVRMIAMIGNAFATADELAAAAHTPPAEARRLVNALSVMGILRRSAGAPALETTVTQGGERPASTGLFSRLRQRWGR